MVKVNDSTYTFGPDTLNLKSGQGGSSPSAINNQYVSAQLAQGWVSGRIRTDSTLTAKAAIVNGTTFTGNEKLRVYGDATFGTTSSSFNFVKYIKFFSDYTTNNEASLISTPTNVGSTFTGVKVAPLTQNSGGGLTGFEFSSPYYTMSGATATGMKISGRMGATARYRGIDITMSRDSTAYTSTTSYGIYVNATDFSPNSIAYALYADKGQVYIREQTRIDGPLQAAGSIKVNRTLTRTNLTLNDTHYYLPVDASGAAITITLPDAATCAGRVYKLKKIDSSSNSVTIHPYGTQQIDGQLTGNVSAQWQLITIISSGTGWEII